jgi:hypothetical protein
LETLCKGFNFFPSRFCPKGQLETPRTKQHICKLANRAKTQVCKRAVFFALAPALCVGHY